MWCGCALVMRVALTREYVVDKLEGGQKMIVFGHHRSLVNRLGTALENRVSCEGGVRGGEGRVRDARLAHSAEGGLYPH